MAKAIVDGIALFIELGVRDLLRSVAHVLAVNLPHGLYTFLLLLAPAVVCRE
jgi:hypothetical protein